MHANPSYLWAVLHHVSDHLRCRSWRATTTHSERDSVPRQAPLCLPYCWVPASVLPPANEWTYNDPRGPFNRVENVQVRRARLHLSLETKASAPYSHTRAEKGKEWIHTQAREEPEHTWHAWPLCFSHALAQISHNGSLYPRCGKCSAN